eukprot:scaffold6392_cov118-Isochrysis_galbana.AAC.3
MSPSAMVAHLAAQDGREPLQVIHADRADVFTVMRKSLERDSPVASKDSISRAIRGWQGRHAKTISHRLMQATCLVKDSLNVCARRAGGRKLAAVSRSQSAQVNTGGRLRTPAGRYREASCSKLARCASQAIEPTVRQPHHHRCSPRKLDRSRTPGSHRSGVGLGAPCKCLSRKGSAVRAHQLQVVRDVKALLKRTTLKPVEAGVTRALHLHEPAVHSLWQGAERRGKPSSQLTCDCARRQRAPAQSHADAQRALAVS